jgi:hypothetical protein
MFNKLASVCLTQKRKNSKKQKRKNAKTLYAESGQGLSKFCLAFVTVLYFGHVSAGLTFKFWIKCYKNFLS